MEEYKVRFKSMWHKSGDTFRFVKANSPEEVRDLFPDILKKHNDTLSEILEITPTISVGELWSQWVKSKEV